MSVGRKGIASVFALLLTICLRFSAYAASSGTWGDNLTWTMDDEGTIIFSGKGKMAENIGNSLPNHITSIIISDGITNVGEMVFITLGQLTSVSLPDSIRSIDRSAFIYCTSLKKITIPGKVTTIDEY